MAVILRRWAVKLMESQRVLKRLQEKLAVSPKVKLSEERPLPLMTAAASLLTCC